MPTTNQKDSVVIAFGKRLRSREVMPYDEFIDFALYDEEIGYYSSLKKRVGRSENTDFYTSSSFGSLWGELIVDACKKILQKETLAHFTFVEIAAEPGQSILDGVQHPFEKSRVIRLGEDIDIPSPAVVYSNEWLDAQSFKRFRFSPESKIWQELGVSLENNSFQEKTLDSSQTSKLAEKFFPKDYSGTYQIDWPSGSVKALDLLCKQSWSGLFLTFDYGLSKQALLRERPLGTARSYYRHKLVEDLLARAGEQDITCHLCWDELQDILKHKKFTQSALSSQESFLMNHASGKIQEIFSKTSDNPSEPRMQALKEIMHPAHLGTKFQALWGLRE
jgi:SAM-dependent MidA family methyltransferase